MKQISTFLVILIFTAFYSKDKTEVMPCTISVVNNQIEIKSGDNSWLLFIYKLEKKEWIFGDHKTLLYFAKPL